MKRVFIYGVPGIGKTYLARKLGKELGIPVIEGDKIKDKARRVLSKSEYPFVYQTTCTAYKQFGPLNSENAVKGLLAVRAALKDAVLAEIKDEDSFILEAAFLDPGSLKDLGEIMLLTVPDESHHRKQFLTHLDKRFDLSQSEFKAARLIQNYLVSEAKNLGIKINENPTIPPSPTID